MKPAHYPEAFCVFQGVVEDGLHKKDYGFTLSKAPEIEIIKLGDKQVEISHAEADERGYSVLVLRSGEVAILIRIENPQIEQDYHLFRRQLVNPTDKCRHS